MKITVVGAMLIIAGVVAVVLVIYFLLDRGNPGPEQDSPPEGPADTRPPGV